MADWRMIALSIPPSTPLWKAQKNKLLKSAVRVLLLLLSHVLISKTLVTNIQIKKANKSSNFKHHKQIWNHVTQLNNFCFCLGSQNCFTKLGFSHEMRKKTKNYLISSDRKWFLRWVLSLIGGVFGLLKWSQIFILSTGSHWSDKKKWKWLFWL